MSQPKFYQIAIDGPAGSGKSTIAKYFAHKNPQFMYVNTGLMFRALAYLLIYKNIDLSSLENMLKKNELSLDLDNNTVILFKDQKPYLTLEANQLTDSKIANQAANIAKNEHVRKFLKEQQQKIANTKNVIMDGRDIGTMVLPQAQIKIFLIADPYVRAQRRFLELKNINQNHNESIDEIYQQILERDAADYNRPISPLKKANDAIEIDSTKLNIDEIYEIINNLYLNFKKN